MCVNEQCQASTTLLSQEMPFPSRRSHSTGGPFGPSLFLTSVPFINENGTAEWTWAPGNYFDKFPWFGDPCPTPKERDRRKPWHQLKAFLIQVHSMSINTILLKQVGGYHFQQCFHCLYILIFTAFAPSWSLQLPHCDAKTATVLHCIASTGHFAVSAIVRPPENLAMEEGGIRHLKSKDGWWLYQQSKSPTSVSSSKIKAPPVAKIACLDPFGGTLGGLMEGSADRGNWHTTQTFPTTGGSPSQPGVPQKVGENDGRPGLGQDLLHPCAESAPKNRWECFKRAPGN